MGGLLAGEMHSGKSRTIAWRNERVQLQHSMALGELKFMCIVRDMKGKEMKLYHVPSSGS